MSLASAVAADFGTAMFCLGVAVKGKLGPEDAEVLTRELVASIGMTEVGSCLFPYPDRNIGFIHVRALIESCIVVDSWHPHIEGAYIFINSCKDFEPSDVFSVLEGAFGLKVIHTFDTELSL